MEQAKIDYSNKGLEEILPTDPNFDEIRLQNVTEINLENNSLKTLPAEIFLCTQLKTLKLSGNPIEDLPLFAFVNLKSLEYLSLDHKNLKNAQLKAVFSNPSVKNDPKEAAKVFANWIATMIKQRPKDFIERTYFEVVS